MNTKRMMRTIAKSFMGVVSSTKFKLKDYTSLKYKDLYLLSYYSSNSFKKTKKRILESNISTIKNKSVIKVGFVTYSLSMWNVAELVACLENDTRFDVSIIVGKFRMPDHQAMISTFEKSVHDFKKTYGDKVKTTQDKDFNIEEYDILFYCTPFDFYDDINIRDLKLTQLVCYVSYSYMLAEKIDKLDLPAYFLSWKMFCDSKYYMNLVRKRSRVYGDNAVFLGFLKMDPIYKIAKKSTKDKKVIIYAPHHSLTSDRAKFSTFDMNYIKILELAKKYKNKLTWIVKPHPMLRSQSVAAGLFKTEEEYDEYLNEWIRSGSGIVVENGDYMQLFVESDAMITDSVSFIAEYQFTHNPLLLLESGQQKYNEFGERIRSILYKCDGNDIEQIDTFINNVLVEKDPDYEKRFEFFNNELDYYTDQQKLAYERIYDLLSETFTVQ